MSFYSLECYYKICSLEGSQLRREESWETSKDFRSVRDQLTEGKYPLDIEFVTILLNNWILKKVNNKRNGRKIIS